jgi:hypothetical protein
MSSQYTKFTDEILMKKIKGSYNQCIKLEEQLTLREEKKHNINIENISNRSEMEDICDRLSLYLSELKIKDKEQKILNVEIKRLLEETEKKKAEELKPKEIKYEIINDLELMKRAFFNLEDINHVEFNTELHKFNYNCYKLQYNYNDDMNEKPEYIASNLIKGFIKRLSEYTKYIFGVFRCYKYSKNNSNTYIYQAYILLNTKEQFNVVLGEILDDFTYQLVDKETQFKYNINKIIDDNNLLEEKYIH